MIKNIYFVPTFQNIRPFLSLIEPGESNLIVMSDQKSVNKFVQDIMPDERKLIVPRISATTSINLARRWKFYKLFIDILFYRIYRTRLLRKIPICSTATAYFFTNVDINLLILVNSLSKRGIKIVFIDYVRSNEVFSILDNSRLPLTHQFYLGLLSLVSGLRLSLFQHLFKKKFKLLGWSECIDQTFYKPDSWESVANKFNWQFKNETTNAVLLIDAPMQTLKGVNSEKTQQKLIRYFTMLIDIGKQIHVKPHYGRPNIHSFQGTGMEDKVKVVSPCFPAEFILNYYREIYFFGSYTGSTPCRGKKYSLAKMLVFNSKERHDIFWSGCKYSFGEEMDKIEFIEIDE